MSTKRNGNEACWRWTALAMFTLLLSIGCTPSTFYFLMPWKDDKEPAEMPLTPPDKKKKEVTVVILASFANQAETRPEFQTVDRELCERLAVELKHRFEANGDKIKIIPYYKVRSYLNKEQDAALVSKREVGKHFSADYIINLEINSMSFYEGSYRQLFRGNTEIMVTLFRSDGEVGEGPANEKVYRTEYPSSGPIDAGSESVLSFRTAFLNRLARDLSRLFTEYPTDEKLDMR